MRVMLASFIVCGVLFALAVLMWAAPEVSMLQRIELGFVPLGLAVLITAISWKDA